MPVARFRRDGTPTAAAAVRHAATGTPPGWSQRAACRALKTGKRQTGVYAVELRPGGSVRFLLWRGDPGGQAGQTGDVREKARKDSAEDVPADKMMVESGPSRAARSQQRLASFGKAMGHLKQLIIRRWKAAVQQEKQQRTEREQAEAVTRAEAAAAAEAQQARVRRIGALERELAEVRSALQAERSRRLEERRLAQEALRERRHDDDGDAGGGEAPLPAPLASGGYTPRGLACAGETGWRAAKGRGKGGLSSPPVGGRGKGGQTEGERRERSRMLLAGAAMSDG